MERLYPKKKKAAKSKNKKTPKKNKRIRKIKKIKAAKTPLRKRRRKRVTTEAASLNLAPLFASPLDPNFILSKTDEEVWRRILEVRPNGYALPDRLTFQRLKEAIAPIEIPAPEQ
ncbi:hypothetical protein [Paenibacillus sp. MMO-177]|uniref:hypothetical protein n=1 Tax=Paenibacillus sp. MMO-177 TaxID=3081289 RepID=UPI00301A1BE2